EHDAATAARTMQIGSTCRRSMGDPLIGPPYFYHRSYAEQPRRWPRCRSGLRQQPLQARIQPDDDLAAVRRGIVDDFEAADELVELEVAAERFGNDPRRLTVALALQRLRLLVGLGNHNRHIAIGLAANNSGLPVAFAQ